MIFKTKIKITKTIGIIKEKKGKVRGLHIIFSNEIEIDQEIFFNLHFDYFLLSLFFSNKS
jgi:hypothetical protein